ncbi:MAG TPA: hypothetical protein ENN51_00245 [candidate division WOR-3 bacterium]|uniref:Uncharacterized protein n=1 Tax=candidate division WOR-3 bacterium TaxID=2052148 RepID=A0A7V0XEL7_UNCW3|nr:hypothetical protein [candidate division WOR-3 bacterium]
MKIFTVYLDTHTGRTQVTFEADAFVIKDDLLEFQREGRVVASFAREKTFGFIEEQPASEEGPGFGPGV